MASARHSLRIQLHAGLRAANVTGLTSEQVDLERKQAWVYPDQAKARKAIPVPFNDAAMEVVQRQKGKHFVKVFTFEGEPVSRISAGMTFGTPGVLACAEWDAASCPSGAWRLADGGDGAAVRAPGSRASGRLCWPHQHPWHKHGTVGASHCRLEKRRDSKVSKSQGKFGGPCRSRTYDQEIKSLLLYQLS
jgi:integrase-like protein